MVNPDYRTLDSQIRSLNGKLTRCLSQFGVLNLESEIAPKKVEIFEQKKASLLEKISAFKDELDEKKYVEIRDVASVDKKGKTRLFVGRGKQDGFNAKKLAKIIRERCNIPDSKIQDIQILDGFSFITLPFNEAEKVLAYFKKGKNRSEMFIEKAKKRKKR